MKRRKTQKEMWEYIHEPKVLSIGFIFDKNGQPILKYEIVDRVPRIKRNRRKKND